MPRETRSARSAAAGPDELISLSVMFVNPEDGTPESFVRRKHNPSLAFHTLSEMGKA